MCFPIVIVSQAEQRLAMAQIKVANIPGKKLEHQGIRVQLLGQIEMKSERGAPNDFLSLGMMLHHAVMKSSPAEFAQPNEL